MFKNRFLVNFFILMIWNYSIFAQTSLIDCLNKNLIEIESKQPNDNFAKFNEFSKVLANNKILALGEVTHGIKEFIDFRGTLIKHLVTKLDYKIIVLEADFLGTQVLNDYILYGKGNKYHALLSMGIGIWAKQEFLNTVDWLKAYNLTKSFPNKIKFYGCDIGRGVAVARIAGGGIKLKKDLSDDAKEGLKLMQHLSLHVNKAEKIVIQKLATELNEEMKQLPDSSIFRQSILTVLQSINWFQAGDWYKMEKIRDKYMAENVAWIYEHELNKNMILMAHNTHIAKNPVYDDIKRAGYYLKEKYKDEYYSLGFSFFTGEFLASNEKTNKLEVFTMPEIKNEEFSEYIFSQCNTPNFILDFKTTQNDVNINLFLTKKTYSKNIGASYLKSNKDIKPGYMPLADKFDGIAFFKRTSALLPPFAWDKRE